MLFVSYLHKEASVSKVLPDEENPENLIVQVRINQFRSDFTSTFEKL